MKRQSKKRQNELVAQYPLLGHILKAYSYIRPARIHVQKTSPEAMHLKISDNVLRGGSAYLIHQTKDLRGTVTQFLYAAGEHHEKLAKLFGGREDRREVLSKEIFLKASPEKVAYLVYVQAYCWYKPGNRKDLLFGDEVARELVLIVYPKPRDINFVELVALADQQKKEREEAWKFPPKEQPELPGIHEALRKGYRGHAFSSGGGLRVISFSKGKEQKAYG